MVVLLPPTTKESISNPGMAPAYGASRPRWQCDVCGKLLSSKRSYDEHANIHTQMRPFSCEHCDYAAASQMTLRRHKLRNHTPRQDWGYKCPYCPEAYMEPASYQQHIISRHIGCSATFGCPRCGFTSKCAKHFRDHLERHNATADGSPFSAFLQLDKLAKYLVKDEYGVGYGQTVTHRRVVRLAPEVALSGKIRNIQKKPTTTFQPFVATQRIDKDFMKAPLMSHPSAEKTTTRRVSVTHEGQTYRRNVEIYREPSKEDDKPPVLTAMSSVLEDADWIEHEEEVVSSAIYPDGSVDFPCD